MTARRIHAPRLLRAPGLRRDALLIAAAIAAVLSGGPAGAQGLGLTTGSDQPVVIEADKGVEWRQKQQIYLAKGNATAIQGKTRIRADQLAAHYRKEEAGNKIWKVTATGSVKINTEKETIDAQKAVYLVETGEFTLTGNNLKIVSEKQTVTARDRIRYNSQSKVAHVVGNAIVVEEDKRVRADRFVAYMADGPEGKTSLTKVDAVGNVVITTKTEVLRGDRGDYDGKTKIATLTGNVRLTRCDNQLNGEKAIVNLETGISRMVGRVQGMFIPREGEKQKCGTPGDPDETASRSRSTAPNSATPQTATPPTAMPEAATPEPVAPGTAAPRAGGKISARPRPRR